MDTLGTFQLGDFKSHMENGMFHQNVRKHQQVSPNDIWPNERTFHQPG